MPKTGKQRLARKMTKATQKASKVNVKSAAPGSVFWALRALSDLYLAWTP